MSEPTSPRAFHLSLNVADLDRSVDYYRVLFACEPARHEADYAKFEVTDPPVVLALEPRAPGAATGALNHVGIRVGGRDDVEAMADRLATMGVDAQLIENVACCYSHQTKVCTWDPDGTLWEFYVLEEDGASSAAAAPRPTSGAAAGGVVAGGTNGAGSAPPTAVRAHLLGEPFPDLDSLPAASLDAVHLRGTLNAPLEASREAAILASVRRALKPGGAVELHMLVGDRPVDRTLPTLPGPAALVERVPVATDVVRAIEAAGFVGLEFLRYSHEPVYRFAGVEMRELLLRAHTRSAADAIPTASAPAVERRTVLYKGPFRALTDDDGVVYPRGEHVLVTPATYETLRRSGGAEHFVFVSTDGGCAPDGCAAPG